MFNELIESNGSGANTKSRKRYFLVTSLGVGILFASAVVVSIFAAEYGLGTDKFEVSMLMAPVPPIAPEPPKPAPAPRQDSPAPVVNQKAVVPTRVQNVLRIDESPKAPTAVSTTPNKVASRPIGDFKIDTADTNVSAGPARTDGIGTGTGLSNGDKGVGSGSNAVADTRVVPDPPKPPVREVEPPKPPSPPKVQSLGVINGRATHLPTPAYSQAAKAVNAAGTVQVQVLIDENGNVVSATAVSGHPLLQASAVAAARNAKFSPTKLSNVPVKVSGVISYNFRRDG